MTRILCLMLMLWTTAARADDIRLAVTTSFHNSGLADVLLPAIKADTGLDVRLLVVGTGQALRLGRSGDVDAILVHSKAAEQAFVVDGFAPHRREIMYNDFIILGPADDPARVRGTDTARAALAAIAQARARFVSRGDDSGTHNAERALWADAALDPGTFGPWYSAVGAGMGASLNTAAALDAYILSDRASWLNFANPRGLAILFAGDPALFNQYAYLPVSATRHPHVRAIRARTLETWLTGPAARRLIDGHRVKGAQLFTFNAIP